MTAITVLREGAHGMPIDAYAAALRERLPEATIRVARTPDDERELIAGAEVVTAPMVTSDLIDRAESLDLFACMYAGTDHLPIARLQSHGIAVTSAAGIHGPTVAEHVLGSILAFSRRFHVGRRRQARREWRHYQVTELAGSTVAVVGLGAIGTAVLERLSGFGVKTVGVRHSPGKGGPTDHVYGYDRIHDALAIADYLVLACPLTDVTEALIDEAAFRTLGPESIVVNVARGPVIETDALVAALRADRIRGAALDVTDPEPLPQRHPLWTFDNVLITPHNAGHTPRYYERLADIVAENVRLLEGGNREDLRNLVTPDDSEG